MKGRIGHGSAKLAAALAALLAAGVGPAYGQDARQQLGAAVQYYMLAEFEEALVALGKAELAADTPELLALILYRRGVVLETLDRRLDALVDFVRAFTVHPEVRADTHELRSTALRLLQCARTLSTAGMDLDAMRQMLAEDIERPDWRCPVAAEVGHAPGNAPRMAPPEVEPPPPIPPPPPAAVSVEIPREPSLDPAAAASRWRWGFLGAGAAVAAGGLALDLALPTGSNQKVDAADFVGVSLMAIGVGAMVAGVFFNPFEGDED